MKNSFKINQKNIIGLLVFVLTFASAGFSNNIENYCEADSLTSEVKEDAVIVEFEADHHLGYIGFIEDESDVASDNMFKINIDQEIPSEKEVWLSYELEGVSNADAISMSINDEFAKGGYLVKKSKGWKTHKEKIDAGWLKQGNNIIQFAKILDFEYRYAVRNVKILVSENKIDEDLYIRNEGSHFDGMAYISGFTTKEDKVVYSVVMDGIEEKINKASFDFLIHKTEEEKSKKHWKKDIIFNFSDGTRLTRSFNFKTNEGSPDFVSKINTTFSQQKLFKKDEINSLELKGAKILIDTDVLIKDEKNISIKSLRDVDMPALEMDMENVSGEGYHGYRFLPHGEHFENQGALIGIAYDESKIPQGYTVEDIRTFYYNTESKRWVVLNRDSIDRENKMIYSRVYHFTDYINGVINTPESPESSAYVPTSFNDIAAASPMAGVQLMSPPSQNNMGDANLSYSIVVPPGRQGMQPNLNITYNSSGGNGVMGLGWNLNIPSIDVETRWGVPRYDADMESETYLLNGEMLVGKDGDNNYLSHRDNWINRETITEFLKRKQSSNGFEKVERIGTNPKDYRWVVTDRNGTKYYYGHSSTSAALNKKYKLTTGGNIYKWYLWKVVDVYGNTMTYDYQVSGININGSNVKAHNRYLKTIEYTGFESITDPTKNEVGKYLVSLDYDEVRPDKQFTARTGGLVNIFKKVLKVSVYINKDPSTVVMKRIRSYEFRYKTGHFQKTLLERIVHKDASGGVVDEHKFDYFDDVNQFGSFGQPSSDINIPFGSSDLLETTDYDPPSLVELEPSLLGGGLTRGKGFSIYGGIGPINPKLHEKTGTGGIAFSHSISDTDVKKSLIDIDGNGLPDFLFEGNGNISPYLNNYRGTDGVLTAFSGNISIPSMDFSVAAVSINFPISKTNTWNTSVGVQTNFNLGADQGNIDISVDGGINISKSKTRSYLSDANGDGFVDFIHDGMIYFNEGFSNNAWNIKTKLCSLACSIEGGSVDDNLWVRDNNDQDEMIENHPMLDAVRVWTAPRDGNITIVGDVSNIGNTHPEGDGVIPVIQYQSVNQTPNVVIFNMPENILDAGQTMLVNIGSGAPFFVEKGDRIFFRVRSGNMPESNGEEDVVEWEPVITYLNPAPSSVDPYQLNSDVFNPVSDFIPSHLIRYPFDPSYFKMDLAYNLSVGSGLSDNVRFEIVGVDGGGNEKEKLITTLISQASYGGNISISRNDLDMPFLDDANSSFYLRLSSNSNVNWSDITINFVNISIQTDPSTPPVNYVEIEDPSVNYEYFDCASGNYNPSTTSVQQGLYRVKSHTIAFKSPSPFPIVPSFENEIVYLNIRTENKILYQRSFKLNNENEAIPHETLVFDMTGGDMNTFMVDNTSPDLFMTVTTRNPILMDYLVVGESKIELELNGNVTEYVLNSFWDIKLNQRASFANGFRGWGHFMYNGGSADAGSRNLIPATMWDANTAITQGDDNTDPSGLEVIQMLSAKLEPTGMWLCSDETTFINGNIMQSSRLGLDHVVIENPLSNASGGGTCGSRNGITLISKNVGYYGQFGAGPPPTVFGPSSDVALQAAFGRTRSLVDYRDMNGDRYPDVLLPGTIISTTPRGNYSFNHSVGTSTTTGSQDKFGFSYGGSNLRADYPAQPGKGSTKPAENGSIDAIGNAGLDASRSKVTEEIYYLDINGDGLPDLITREDGNDDTDVKVQINLGYAFSSPISFDNWVCRSSVSSSFNLSGGLAFPFEISKRKGSFKVGLSISSTLSSGRINTIDINGDGLIDMIDEGTFTNPPLLYLNTGSGFVPVPGYLPNENLFSTNSFGSSLNGAFTIGIPLVAVKIAVNFGFNKFYGLSRKRRSFMDLNGDGFADFLKAKPGVIDDGVKFMNVSAQYSNIGRTNKLKKVTNSFRGTFEMDYALSAATVDHPNGKWVMSSVSVDDGVAGDGENVITQTFGYAQGKYDRCEREFMGFGVTTSTDVIPRTTTKSYLTDYYTKGFMTSSEVTTIGPSDDPKYWVLQENTPVVNRVTYDNMGISDPTLVQINPVTYDPLMAYNSNDIIFVGLEETKQTFYEGETDKANGLVGSNTAMNYDKYGNVIRYFFSNEGTELVSDYSNHDYVTKIQYEQGSSFINNNLIALPKVVSLSSSDASRMTTAKYNENGSPLEIVKNNIAKYNYTYDDDYGNIKSVTLPDNGFDQRMKYEYEYESVLNTHVNKITDAYNYETFFGQDDEAGNSGWNYKFGVPFNTRNINNVVTKYTYDAAGRMLTMSNPLAGGEAIIYKYDIPSSVENAFDDNLPVPHAISTRIDNHNGDPLITSTFVDGLGRTVSTLYDVCVDQGTGKPCKASIAASGCIEYDNVGRVIKTKQPSIVGDQPDEVNDPNDVDFSNYQVRAFGNGLVISSVEYDVMNRPLDVFSPTGNMSTRYSLDVNRFFKEEYLGGLDGGYTRKTDSWFKLGGIVTQQDIHSVPVVSPPEDISIGMEAPSNGPESKVTLTTQYFYDDIEQLISVVNPKSQTTTYLYDDFGRLMSRTHPDAGTTTYSYGNAGNVISVVNPASSVNHNYHYSRVKSTSFSPDEENNVTYYYGSENSSDPLLKGRVTCMTDGSGMQVYEYNEIGQVIEEQRVIGVPFVGKAAGFTTRYDYDIWNRVQHIQYPDGELVSYGYDRGGQVNKVIGNKPLSISDDPDVTMHEGEVYVEEIGYDVLGSIVRMQCGNDVSTRYEYDKASRWVRNIQSESQSQGNVGLFMDLVIEYNDLGNIMMTTNEIVANSELKGKTTRWFKYDNLFRLEYAKGQWDGKEAELDDGSTVPNQSSFEVNYRYDEVGNFSYSDYKLDRTDKDYPKSMTTQNTRSFDDYWVTPGSSNSNRLHNMFEVTSNLNPEVSLSSIKRDVSHVFSYDGNGSISTEINAIKHGPIPGLDHHDEPVSNRKHIWHARNLMSASNVNGLIANYFYDGNGIRVLKATEKRHKIFVNGENSGSFIGPLNYTMYVSPLFVLRHGHYTKHYFIGSQRVASKIGDSKNYSMEVPESMGPNIQYTHVGIGDEPITEIIHHEGSTEAILSSNYEKFGIVLADFVRRKHDGSIDPNVDDDGYGLTLGEEPSEPHLYFFSKDHLGSSSYITTREGSLIQHLEYLPFGEVFVDERNITIDKRFETRYRFNGKEQDCETGYYYYGARYHNPNLGRFLSVDPLADAFPSQSSYLYAYNNPVRYIDVNGMYGDESEANKQRGAAINNGLDVGEVYQSGDEWGFNVLAGEDSYSAFDKDFKGVSGRVSEWGARFTGPEGGAAKISEFMMSLNPLVNGHDAVVGESMITGEELSGGQRTVSGVMAAISFVPALGMADDAAKTGRVFWSGGSNVAGKAAETFARANGMKTLEMTLQGKLLTSLTNATSFKTMEPFWKYASASYARGATGTVNVFHNASSGVRLKSVWKTIEYPILKNNNNNIIYHNVFK